MISWWELGTLASLVGLGVLISLWNYKAHQRDSDAHEELFSGFSHGINSALKAGFRVEWFENRSFPQCRLVCSLKESDPQLTLYVRLSGGRRGSIFTESYDLAAREHFRARPFEKQYSKLSSSLSNEFYDDIDAKFFSAIIAQHQGWLMARTVTGVEACPHRTDVSGVERTRG